MADLWWSISWGAGELLVLLSVGRNLVDTGGKHVLGPGRVAKIQACLNTRNVEPSISMIMHQKKLL